MMPKINGVLHQKILHTHCSAHSGSELISHHHMCLIQSSENQLYNVAMTTLPPVPESIIQLTPRGYKTGCTTNRRQYLKNELKCSEMCKCQDCENDESKDLIGVHNYILEDNEIHLNQPMNTYDEVY